MSLPRIPFNRVGLTGAEFDFMQAALRQGHIAGDGEFTGRCARLLEQALGSAKCLLTTSCTHALEMSALLLDLKEGDEVLLPSFTFVSTANAYCLRGVTPRFIDVRPDTLNIDERALAQGITPQVKAIVVVHYAGVGCEMDPILAVAQEHGLPVVEDNAHGLFGRYRGRPLGSFGAMSTLSFHETKNISCGEGGALCLNDARLIERAEILREKGTNRSRFFRGEVDKYTWVDLGSSYLPSDLLAAFLCAQLEAAGQIQAKRERVWHRYASALRGWAMQTGTRLPFAPEHCEQAYHMFYMILPSEGSRDALIAHLRKRFIHAVFHYLPLHLSPVGRRFGGAEGDCPVTEEISRRLIRLPFFADLSESDQDRVIEGVMGFEG